MDIQNFFPDEQKSQEETELIVKETVFQLLSLIKDLKTQNSLESKQLETNKSLSLKVWEFKLESLQSSIKTRTSYECLLALSIFKNEISRLNLSL